MDSGNSVRIGGGRHTFKNPNSYGFSVQQGTILCVAKFLVPTLMYGVLPFLVIPGGRTHYNVAEPKSLSKGFNGDAVALLIFFLIESSSRMVMHLPRRNLDLWGWL